MDEMQLKACMEGDEEAWCAFVERWSGVILRAVQRTIHGRGRGLVDPDLLHDVAQDVFVRLLKDDRRLLRSYDAERASISTWLTLVSRSVAIDGLRRRRLETVSLDQGGREAAAPFGGAAGSQPGSGTSGPEIPWQMLSARQRLVLVMLFEQEMSVPEAARLLDVDEQTVRSTKHKALRRLREHLAAEEGGSGSSQTPGG